jgi:hypothetical protein
MLASDKHTSLFSQSINDGSIINLLIVTTVEQFIMVRYKLTCHNFTFKMAAGEPGQPGHVAQ